MIKILSKKQWRMVCKRIDNLNIDLFNTKVSLDCYIERVCKQKIVIKDLQEEKKKLQGTKGGLKAKINRLENKIKHLEELKIEMDKQYKELEEKYKESMTNKYLVKKLKPGRTPKTTSMKLKDCSRVSNITRKVINHYEKEI